VSRFRPRRLTAPTDDPYDGAMSKGSRKPGRHLASASTLVSSFLETADAVEARLEAAVAPMGLSLAKLGLLHHLAEAKEPLPLSELAQHQNCVRSNITQLVDRLEKEGLVRRRPDPQDRRSVRAALTPAGEQAYQKAKRALAEEQRAIVESLSSGDAASLRGVLDQLGPE
jgi:DNA-binding MarR family transcriptional regulator